MSNALNITPKNHATVVETENAMILMGNYYQKEDMSCISKKGCIFNNISVGNIINCCKGRCKTCGGYIWKYNI